MICTKISLADLSNKFNFWNVHGIMNTPGLFQRASRYLCKRPEVFMIP